MPRRSAAAADPAAAAPWLGGPLPVSADGFVYANGEFWAEASGHQRHRRAPPAELQAHFASGSARDRPAHWFEAQLIHYGLPPSRTKAVARMRLLDALNAGPLVVPAALASLEARLKRESSSKHRKAAKLSSAASPPPSKQRPMAAAKRKAAAEVSVSVTVNTNLGAAGGSAKRAKRSPARTQPLARRGAVAPSRGRATSSSAGRASPTPVAPSRLCRRSKPFGVRGRIAAPLPRQDPPSPPAPRVKQTARRSGAFFARGRIPPPLPQDDDDDDNDNDNDHDSDPPPPYSEDEIDGDAHQHTTVSLAPLGLLNGSYDISCPTVTSEWPQYDSDFELVLTLAGPSLWGIFDLGVVRGVLYFEERPWKSSYDCLPFQWRGREAEGPIIYGDNNQGWIRFLGHGRVQGWLGFQNIEFHGQRLSGQGTWSGVDARSIKNEWSGYSEQAYDEENRSRWR